MQRDHKRGSRLGSDVGVDHPLPKRTALYNDNLQVQLASVPSRPIGLDPGTKLASKFPHLVKGVAPTKGDEAGGGN